VNDRIFGDFPAKNTMYICTVYDRIFGNFPAKNTVYIHTIYDRIFGDFPAENAVNAPHICIYIILANPMLIPPPELPSSGTCMGFLAL